MVEWRRHPRVREEISVRWSIPAERIKGKGIVRNVSISGLLMEVDEHFKPSQGAIVTVEMADGTSPGFIPKQSVMMWFSYLAADQKRRFCGLRFVDPTGPAFSRLKEHVDGRLDAAVQAGHLNMTNRYLYQSN